MMAIDLPCIMQLDHQGYCPSFARVKALVDSKHGRLCLLGDHFSVSIPKPEIATVISISGDTSNRLMSVQIQDRSGGTLLTLFGANSAAEIAVWGDIMGNPCQPYESLEARLNNS